MLLIPVYNHHEKVTSLVEELDEYEIPGVLINDGSNEKTYRTLEEVSGMFERWEVIHRDRNGGKGKAVMTGLEYAEENGYTHAIQIDADFQHDPAEVPTFLDAAEENPEALVLGIPQYDSSVPKGRLYGRHISRIWVWIETLSTVIEDPLCGYRCYPVSRVMEIIRNNSLGEAMDFDPEIAVRFYWSGGRIVTVDTPVKYFPGGISNFDLFWDNVKISWMHCRLFFGMLLRFPLLLSRHFRK